LDFTALLLSQCLKAKSIGGGIHFDRKESQKVGDYPKVGKKIPLPGAGLNVNVSEILQLVEIKDLLIASGLCHFHGMMEYWNNVLKTYNFSVRIKVFGINFHYFSMIGLSHES
jgi:hypothetical protein